jgi:O-antigen/teichoic acid export membrane protein
MKVSTLCSLPAYAITRIAAPAIAARHAAGDPADLERYTRRISLMMFLSTLPLCLFILFLAGPIMKIFGPEFSRGVPALVILTGSTLVNASTGPVGIFLQMTGKEKVFQSILLFTVTLHCGITVLLIPRFGITGAALAGALDLVLWNLLAVFFIRRHNGFYTLPRLGFIRPGRRT